MTFDGTAHRLIATEEHFVPDTWFEDTAGLDVAPGEEQEHGFMRAFGSDARMRDRITDPATQLSEMDRTGVDTSVLSLSPPGVQTFRDPACATEMAAAANDRLAALVADHPERFHGLAALAPQDPERAADEVRRAVGTLGLGGVMIGSHTWGHYLDEPRFEPLLSALEEQDATLYLHPRCPSPQMTGPFSQYGMLTALWGFQAETSTHALRLIFSGALDRHPRLRIVLGHLGEGIPCCLWRLDNAYTRIHGWAGEQLGMADLELKPSEYVARQFAVTTSGMSDPGILRFVIDTLGADRVLFAVDYPYEDSSVAVAALADTPMGDEEAALITHRNAERLFRVPSVAAV